MAHIGQELTLGLVGLLRLALFKLEFFGAFPDLAFEPGFRMLERLQRLVRGREREQDQCRESTPLHTPVGKKVSG